jgi:inorganic triphosphatase YgiF
VSQGRQLARDAGDDVGREVELKFDIEPGGASRIGRIEPLADTASTQNDFETLYFDTVDGALRGAGYSLRIRRSGDRYVRTIKRKKASAAGLFDREEWEEEVPDFTLRAESLKGTPLRRWVARAGGGEILAVVRSEVRRSAWQLLHRGSRIEVVLDRGRIVAGAAEARIDELELELLRGRPSALFDLAQLIAAKVPLRLGVLSKSERGHALAEGSLARFAKAEPAVLEPPLSEADAFRAWAYACLRHFRLNEIVLLQRPDAEALHQARVALRRLRSVLSFFRPTLRGKEYQEVREALRWFARHFGDARNLDLLLARLKQGGCDPALLAPLDEAHQRAYRRVSRALRSARARALFLRLVLWIETGGWRRHERAGDDFHALAAARLDKGWKRVAKKARHFGKLEPAERHELRIAVKAMRYSAEFTVPLYAAKPVSTQRDRFVSALKTLQDRLGEANDAWTAETLAAGYSEPLRSAIAGAHSEKEVRVILGAAVKALERAEAAAGYWRE